MKQIEGERGVRVGPPPAGVCGTTCWNVNRGTCRNSAQLGESIIYRVGGGLSVISGRGNDTYSWYVLVDICMLAG